MHSFISLQIIAAGIVPRFCHKRRYGIELFTPCDCTFAGRGGMLICKDVKNSGKRRIFAGRIMKFVSAGAVAAALLATAPCAHAYEPKWPAGPYRYWVLDQDIKDVLGEFGHTIGVPVRIGPEIKSQRVNGSLPDADAKAFLNGLCTSYGIVWYYDGSVLHFSAVSEMKSELMNLGRALRTAVIMKQLHKMGAIEPRFAIRPTADAHVMSVFGPPAYRNYVRQEVITAAKHAETGILVVRGGREGS
jgi:type II secretory pathway component GspD/PulD (secretin)